MSLVSSRVALYHRCTVERDANAATDDGWGNPQPPSWQTHLVDLACRAWATAAREPVDDEKTIVVEDRRMMVPLDADVTEKDRIATVTHRGATILEGPMGIEAVVRRRDHIELVLERLR